MLIDKTEQGHANDFSTARERVFELLKDLQWHNYDELIRVGGNQAKARVLELRQEGWVIESEPISQGKHGNRYRLTTLTQGAPQERLVRVDIPLDSALQLRRAAADDGGLDEEYEMLDDAIQRHLKSAR